MEEEQWEDWPSDEGEKWTSEKYAILSVVQEPRQIQNAQAHVRHCFVICSNRSDLWSFP